MKTTDFAKLFFALVFLHLVTLYRPMPDNTLLYLSKPLLLFSLLAFYVHRTSFLSWGKRWPIVVALVFSLAGDVWLMLPDEGYFVFGLASFLIAQVGYSLHFIRESEKLDWKSAMLSAILPAFALYIANGLLEIPEGQEVAFNLYALVISLMCMSAIQWARSLGRRGVFLVAGALLFYFSDLLLAINSFTDMTQNFPAKNVQILIMLTYSMAQFLLITTVISKAEATFYTGSTS